MYALWLRTIIHMKNSKSWILFLRKNSGSERMIWWEHPSINCDSLTPNIVLLLVWLLLKLSFFEELVWDMLASVFCNGQFSEQIFALIVKESNNQDNGWVWCCSHLRFTDTENGLAIICGLLKELDHPSSPIRKSMSYWIGLYLFNGELILNWIVTFPTSNPKKWDCLRDFSVQRKN
jgi:hypothetical protein